MPGEPNDAPDAFDIRSIRQLVKLMNDNDLAEIDLRTGTQRIRLKKRGGEVIPVIAAPTQAAPIHHHPQPATQTAPTAQPPPSATTGETSKLVEIKSPMLGTFYRSPSPDAEPFVQVGSHVDTDSVVCIIEAMKVFNEITADCSGKIVAVSVENSQPVEYGQLLFRVDPAG